jgi:hypothetical protein
MIPRIEQDGEILFPFDRNILDEYDDKLPFAISISLDYIGIFNRIRHQLETSSVSCSGNLIADEIFAKNNNLALAFSLTKAKMNIYILKEFLISEGLKFFDSATASIILRTAKAMKILLFSKDTNEFEDFILNMYPIQNYAAIEKDFRSFLGDEAFSKRKNRMEVQNFSFKQLFRKIFNLQLE